MKFATKMTLTVLFAAVTVAVYGALPDTNRAQAHDTSHDVAQIASPQSQTNDQAVVYTYVTQPDDTYSYMARKAVQTYGKKTNIILSPAQIIYAETGLTQAASSPLLEVGQKVVVSESLVKQWVEKAQGLSAEVVDAWAVYVPLVDFNTDNVGNTARS